jgi:DNA-binding beta-propeller fold protein YncE
MSELNKLLQQADRVPVPDLWPEIRSRNPRRSDPSTARRLIVAAVALPVAAAGIVLAATAFLGEGVTRRATGPRPGVDPQVTAEVHVGRFPQEIAVGQGAVWVSVNEGPRWFLARVDPETSQVTATIGVFEAGDVAAGAGAVWVTGREPGRGPAVFRIDPSTNRVVSVIPVQCDRCLLEQVAASRDQVWVTVLYASSRSGEVLSIDPASNQVEDRIPIDGWARDLVVGEGAIWVAALTHFSSHSVSGMTVYRIDSGTGAIQAELLAGRIPPAAGVSTPPILALHEGDVWTSIAPGDPISLGSPDTEIVRVEASNNEIAARVPLGGVFAPFASTPQGIWFESGSGNSVLSRLDTGRSVISEELQIHTAVIDGGVDPSGATMWLSTFDRGVLRVDLLPKT